MAIANSYDFSMTRDQIIEAALRKLNALLEGNSANATKITNGAQALNVMTKAWASRGLPIWNVRKAFILPNIAATAAVSQTYVHDMLIGGANHTPKIFVHTQTSAILAAAGTALVVDSISGISASDVIGVELEDTETLIHWTTVNGAPSGSTVTLTTGIPTGESVAVDAHVYAYTTTNRVPRPISILGQWNVNYDSVTRYPINLVDENRILNTKYATTSGPPVQISYRSNYYGDPNTTQGVVLVYPGWGDAANVIELRAQFPFSDFDSSSDEAQMPPEWFEALIYGLAVRLAPEYGLDKEIRLILKKEAQDAFDLALLSSNEDASIFFQPDTRHIE